jgi:heme exporter protein A
VITWENLAKSYGRRRLFAGLSGSIAGGTGLIVTGLNGSGKSTFLKILAGLVRPDVGAVTRPGDRNEIGYAAPHMSLYGELSGAENVQFCMAVRGGPAGRSSVVDILTRVGLARAVDKPVAAYSTGMIQRLRIACAMAHNPAILILDEPTIGLDRDGISLVEQLVAEHVAEGAAIIATNEPEHFGQFNGGDWSGIEMGP